MGSWICYPRTKQSRGYVGAGSRPAAFYLSGTSIRPGRREVRINFEVIRLGYDACITCVCRVSALDLLAASVSQVGPERVPDSESRAGGAGNRATYELDTVRS